MHDSKYACKKKHNYIITYGPYNLPYSYRTSLCMNSSYLHKIPCQPRAHSRVYTHIHRNPQCYCRHTSLHTQMSPGHTRLYLCLYINNMDW